MVGVHGQCAKARSSRGAVRGLHECVRSLACLLSLLTACSLDGGATGPAQQINTAPSSALDGGSPEASTPGLPTLPGNGVDSDASSQPTQPPPTHFDAGKPDASVVVDARTPLPDAAPPLVDASTSDAGVSCQPLGNYAVRIDYDVSWDDTYFTDVYGATYAIFAGGSGTFTFYARLTLIAGNAGQQAVMQACGTTLPDFSGAAQGYTSERYNMYVPSATWSQPTMPTWTVTGQVPCADAGCPFALDPLMAILGGTLQKTTAAGDQVVDPVDQDADGLDGVTYISRGPPELNAADQPYSYITLGASARARKLAMVMGMQATLSGSFESCDAITGDALDPNVEEHALGCTGVVNGTADEVACDAQTKKFLTQVLPTWNVTSARFRAVRVPENSCNTVRTALD